MQRCPQADSRSDSKRRHLDLGKKEDFNKDFIFKKFFLTKFPQHVCVLYASSDSLKWKM